MRRHRRALRFRTIAARAIIVLAAIASTRCAQHDGPPADAAVPDTAPPVDTVAPLDDGAASSCPRFSAGETAGRLASSLIDEASGIAASRDHADVLWVHNDAGNLPQLFAVNSSGALLAVYSLAGVTAEDWEDIALGPGPEGGSYVYVGDIGGSLAPRSTVLVHRVREPTVDSARPLSAPVTLSDFETLELRYSDGGAYDAETLFVDPIGGEIYVVTKSENGEARFFVHDPAAASAPASLELVATAVFGSEGIAGGGKELTAGDIAPAGDKLVLRAARAAFLWPWPQRGAALQQVLETAPCKVILQVEPQGEAIAFAADGQGLFSLSEGARQPLYLYRVLGR